VPLRPSLTEDATPLIRSGAAFSDSPAHNDDQRLASGGALAQANASAQQLGTDAPWTTRLIIQQVAAAVSAHPYVTEMGPWW